MFQNLQQKLDNIFNNNENKISKIINGSLIFLIIFSVSTIPLYFLPNIEWVYGKLFLFDRIVITIFTVEYFCRILAAKNKIKYIFSWYGIIDFLAILPFYLAKFNVITYPEIFISLRAIRVLKFGELYKEELLNNKNSLLSHGNFSANPGEKIEYIIQKHAIVFLMEMIFPIFLVSIATSVLIFFKASLISIIIFFIIIALAIVFFAKAWMDHHYDVLYITNRRVVLQDRELFGSKTNDIPYDTITNIIPGNIGFVNWLFDYGSIEIETAGTSGQFLFTNIPKPHKIVQIITANRDLFLEKK